MKFQFDFFNLLNHANFNSGNLGARAITQAA